MDVLVLKQEQGDYEIILRSDDISYAWEKFKGRIGSARIAHAGEDMPDALHYSNYKVSEPCHLQLYRYKDTADLDIDGCRSEWLNVWPVVFETCEYNIAIRFREDVLDIETEPKINHVRRDVESSFYTDRSYNGKVIGKSGNVKFLNEPGVFKLEFEYQSKGRKHKVWFTFDVVSPKLDTKKDYKRLLHDVNEEYNDIIFRYLATTYQQLARGRVKNDVVWMNIFESIVADYLKNVYSIIRRPHQKVRDVISVAKAEQIKRWTPQLEDEYEEFRLRKELETHHFEYKESDTTVNTKENRFVKHTINTIGRRLAHILDDVLRSDRNEDLSDNHRNALENYRESIQKLERHPFFRTVGRFEGMAEDSLVLQSRPGYQQIYKDWIKLRRGIDLYNGASNIGTLQIWEIYELWCFIKMKRMIRQLLKIDDNPYYESLVSEPKGSLLNPFTDSTMEHVVKYEYPTPDEEDFSEWANQMRAHKGDVITLHYQHTFNRINSDSHGVHTATTEQRPDIVLNIERKSGAEILLTYLYDAKYRVVGDKRLDKDIEQSDLNEITELQGGDYPPSDAINQMHRYRDAIYYGSTLKNQSCKEIIGGYILFPGRGDDATVRRRYYSNSIESVNIGAFPLLPQYIEHSDGLTHEEDDSPYLYDHLKDILLVKNITMEHLGKAVPQRGLHYTKKKPTAKNVYVGYVKADNPQIDLYSKNRATSYYTGHLDFDELDIQALEYLLPIVAGRVQGVYEIESIGFKKLSKIRDLKDGEKDQLRVVFTLGDFVPILNDMISYNKRLHNHEILSLDESKMKLQSLKLQNGRLQ